MPDVNDDDQSIEEQQERDQAVLKLHALQLGEHFDSVEIIVTRYEPRHDCTVHASEGAGNWHARYGSVREWVIKSEERSLTPKPGRLTATSIGNVLGLSQAATLNATMRAVAASGQQPAAAICDYVLTLLAGPGFDANHPDVPAAVGALANAGVLTRQQADLILFDARYPLGRSDVTEREVSDARALIARQDVVAGYRATVMGYLNDVLNVADANLESPLPTPNKFFAA